MHTMVIRIITFTPAINRTEPMAPMTLQLLIRACHPATQSDPQTVTVGGIKL